MTSKLICPPVYPRVGGGTDANVPVAIPSSGLSPRGRGNPTLDKLSVGYPGSIPAWAGEPLRGCRPTGNHPVYPRVGGGTFARLFETDPGNRSIPAWAGEPSAGVR